MAQSLAVIEYLHETHSDSTLLPADPAARAQVRRVAHAIAMDIHPVCNLSVVNRVVELAGGGDARRQAWMQEFIGRGLDAVEAILAEEQRGSFCFGGVPTLADLCLVPQLYNARRWECETARWPRLLAIDKHCGELEAFRSAHPDNARAASSG
jgi:maleylacetoacetate isomerase